ncbi:MAG TPA: peptidase A24 [Firmicutes bacterium]|nr:peptidase A24 [Bacillota bacterium]
MVILQEIFAVSIAGIAVYIDLRYRRIPNSLVAIGFLLGLALNLVEMGLKGLLFSLGGGFLGIALLFIPFALGGMGAGDVKLLGALGALVGPRGVFFTMVYGALAGGVMAVLLLVRHRRLIITLKSIAFGLILFLSGAWGGRPRSFCQGSGDGVSISFPYSLALGVGLIVMLALHRVG